MIPTDDGEVWQAADLTIALAHPAWRLEAVLKALQLQKFCQYIRSDRTQIGGQCLHQKPLNSEARQRTHRSTSGWTWEFDEGG